MKKLLGTSFVFLLAAVAVAFSLWAMDGRPTLLGGSSIARADSSQPYGTGYKTLTVATGYLYSAVVITKVTVGDKQMLIGGPISARLLRSTPNLIFNARPFQAGDDWIAKTTIYIKNLTDKTISWMSLEIWFPETGNGSPGQPMSLLPISLGRIPDAALSVIRTRSGKPLHIPPTVKPLNLQPGQIIAVHLNAYLDRIKSLVENAMPPMMVTRLKVDVGSCFFNDGMRWGGYYSIPDPDHPGKLKNFPEDYFPGNPHLYWRRGLKH